ncbi:MAG: ADP-ribosylglycohydrolase family protein [Deltaproteobacteria bacterium]|nr:ADP-ribosylglycohydrolase family protein [Deltaproteobacteria bacterium]
MELSADCLPMLGAALGDALGAGVEGGRALQRGIDTDVESVGRRFLPYSPFGFKPGELTDDTQMAWAALSALRTGALPGVDGDGAQYLERVGRAYRSWYASHPPDVGATTAASLRRPGVAGGFERSASRSAGNGSLMRATAPYVAGYRAEALLRAAALDSALTHADSRCVASCVWYAATIEAAAKLDEPTRFRDAIELGLEALQKADVVGWLEPLGRSAPSWAMFCAVWPTACEEVAHVVRAAAEGHHVNCLETPWQRWPTGFVLDSLGQAVWAAVHSDRADEGLRLAVLHGGRDADTIGAIAGGLLGARFGPRALTHWDPELVGQLRLGHHWAGVETEGRFVDLLAATSQGIEPLRRSGLERVLALIQRIEARPPPFAETRMDRSNDGALSITTEECPELEELTDALRDANLIQPFDWPSWQDEAIRYFERPEILDGADLRTVTRLLTLHVRKDRFSEGHFAAMLDNGHVQAILRRLRVLLGRS